MSRSDELDMVRVSDLYVMHDHISSDGDRWRASHFDSVTETTLRCDRRMRVCVFVCGMMQQKRPIIGRVACDDNPHWRPQSSAKLTATDNGEMGTRREGYIKDNKNFFVRNLFVVSFSEY